MMQSMTGYGKSVAVACNHKITVELRSLNSKQLDLLARIPHRYVSVEHELRSLITSRLGRGKVDLTITCEAIGAAQSGLNIELLKAYKEQIEELNKALSLPEPTDWHATLMRMPDALKADSEDEPNEQELEALKQATNEAIDALAEFRKQEGKKLRDFFANAIENIGLLLDEVPNYEQARIEKVKTRILDALDKLKGVDYDKNRFEQELIFYIEKLDITEEKTRLGGHLDYFMHTMDNENRQGKKLGFITQEIGREINTMGSKANDAELQKLVVRMKDFLEQIKEQVLNVL